MRTAPVISPVRWWRDDATRYQSRPPIGVCRTQPAPLEIELIRPSPLSGDLLRYLDDVERWHKEYQAQQVVAWNGIVNDARVGGLNGGCFETEEREWHRRVFGSLGVARP